MSKSNLGWNDALFPKHKFFAIAPSAVALFFSLNHLPMGRDGDKTSKTWRVVSVHSTW